MSSGIPSFYLLQFNRETTTLWFEIFKKIEIFRNFNSKFFRYRNSEKADWIKWRSKRVEKIEMSFIVTDEKLINLRPKREIF